MTDKALRLSGGIRCDNDGGTFAEAPHRAYTRRSAEGIAEAKRLHREMKGARALATLTELAKVPAAAQFPGIAEALDTLTVLT